MSNPIQRLKQYIDYKHISVRKFEESIGFSNGAFSSQYKRNKTIGSDKLEKVFQVYADINPEWVMTGNGTMLRSTYTNFENETNPAAIGSEIHCTYSNPAHIAKYIHELEKKIQFLEKDNQQKQDIIEGFLSGRIVRTDE